MKPAGRKALEEFLDAGLQADEELILPAALDELAERLAGRGCVGNPDPYGVCDTCGKILLGWHSPDGCNPFANVAWRTIRSLRCVRGRARWHLGRIRAVDVGLTPRNRGSAL